LDAERIALGAWTPLEFERRFTGGRISINKDRTIERRHKPDWTHRTRFDLNGRDADFPSKSGRDSFVDLIPVEVGISRNRWVSHPWSPGQSADARRLSRVVSIVS
jgi:hypothetical protein